MDVLVTNLENKPRLSCYCNHLKLIYIILLFQECNEENLFGGPFSCHKYLNIGEGDTMKIMLKLLIYYRKGVPIELPHKEDSADQ